MARLIGLLPTVTAFAAFILGILCLFAGTKSNFMASVDILTVCGPFRVLLCEAADGTIAVYTRDWECGRSPRFLFNICDVLLQRIH